MKPNPTSWFSKTSRAYNPSSYKDESTSLSLCGDGDGGIKDLEEEDHGEDQNMSSFLPDLFFSVHERTVVDIYVRFFVWGAFLEVAPFEEVAPHSMVVWYVRDDRSTNR
jgi:hypothetical protein